MTQMSDQQPSRPCTTQWTVSYWLDPDQIDNRIRVAFALDDPQGTYTGAPTLCPHYENVRAFNRVFLGTEFDFSQRQSAEDIRDIMDDLDDDLLRNVGLARDVTTDAIYWEGAICKVEVTVTDGSPTLLSMPPSIIPRTDMSPEEARGFQLSMRRAARASRREQSRCSRQSQR